MAAERNAEGIGHGRIVAHSQEARVHGLWRTALRAAYRDAAEDQSSPVVGALADAHENRESRLTASHAARNATRRAADANQRVADGHL